MPSAKGFPVFDDRFPDLNQFSLGLVAAYEAGKIRDWEHLEQRVRLYFTPQRMEQIESKLPGWQEMASYSEGITLVHVMCVFLGMFMLPEFRSLTPEQQQLAKWIVLFHDVAKLHVRGKRDALHALRSGVLAARELPGLGFQTTSRYHEMIPAWSEFTLGAFIAGEQDAALRPDNQKLSEILRGIDELYGRNSPAALIVKTVLLHISLDVDPFYPAPAPLTEEEIKRHIDADLLPLLRVMMLADNEGWSLFDVETRNRQRKDTPKAFQRIEQMISTETRE